MTCSCLEGLNSEMPVCMNGHEVYLLLLCQVLNVYFYVSEINVINNVASPFYFDSGRKFVPFILATCQQHRDFSFL